MPVDREVTRADILMVRAQEIAGYCRNLTDGDLTMNPVGADNLQGALEAAQEALDSLIPLQPYPDDM